MMKSGAVPYPPDLPDRRSLLRGAAATAAAPLLTALSSPIVGRVLAMSDLHSAYERTGQLLSILDAKPDAPGRQLGPTFGPSN